MQPNNVPTGPAEHGRRCSSRHSRRPPRARAWPVAAAVVAVLAVVVAGLVALHGPGGGSRGTVVAAHPPASAPPPRPAATTVTPSAPATGVFALPLAGPAQTITPQFFGMTSQSTLDPPIPFGAERLWDTGTTWAQLEPARQQFSFTTLDARVNAAQGRHAGVLLTLAGTPAWASSRPTEQTAYGPGASSPPRNLDDWRTFVRTLATRYRGRISGYEVWNEPSDSIFWHGTGAQLEQLTAVAWEEIHRIDPKALVLMAGMNLSMTDATATMAEDFLAAGGGRNINGVCVHLYPRNGSSVAANAALIDRMRSVLARWKLSRLPVWICETGYGRAAQNVYYTGEQARALVARNSIEAAYVGMAGTYWYAYDTRGFVGLYLVGPDRKTPTDAATAYASTYRWMVGARFLGCAVDSSTRGTQVWACKLQRGAGVAWAVWRVGGAATVLAPPGTGRSEDLLGAVHEVRAGTRIAVGQAPLLLTPAGWTS